MGDVSGIHFNADLGVLICQVHGAAVRPGATSIARHLRSPGHELSGKTKTKAIATLASLPLRSIEEVKRSCPSAYLQPVSPVPYVKVLDGWSCVRCRGNTLTTNHETIRRHVSDKHGRTAADHSVDKPLWERCSLQTLFSSTNDTHYFRVESDPQPSRATTAAATPGGQPSGGSNNSNRGEEGSTTPHRATWNWSDDNDVGCDDTEAFLECLRTERAQHEADASARANVNPDADSREGGVELWMTRLGLDRYLAGLRKDEMIASYKVAKTEERDLELRELCEISEELLWDTLRSCQPGPQQRMTEPQSNRISKFWRGADPEGRAASFRTHILSGSAKGYIRHWTEFLTFCWRGWAGELFPNSLEDVRNKAAASSSLRAGSNLSGNSGDDDSDSQSTPASGLDGWAVGPRDKFYERYFHMSSRQETCLNDFVNQASTLDGDDKPRRDAVLKKAAVAFAQAVIEQHLAKSPFHSPLVAYVAMHSVAGSGTWMEPGSFNSHLSALIYCGQLWIFRFACDKVDSQTSMLGGSRERDPDVDDGLDQALEFYMQEFFSNEQSKPYGSILLWRRRLFNITKETMVDRVARWDPATRTVVSFLGRSVSMDQLRLLCHKTIERARCTLYDQLLFAAEHLPRLRPEDLQETDHERTPGWWFGKHRQNATVLRGHKEALAEHVASTPNLRSLWMEEQDFSTNQKSLVWRRSSIQLYRELTQTFLKDLAAVVHLSSGPPVRAPEILSPMWRNTERLRHIQLRNGKVMIHLLEHKMMATTGRTRDNIRFLCDELGELLVNYLVYVVPLLESMAWQGGSEDCANAFLWVDEKGDRWHPEQFSSILEAACRRAGVPELNTKVWRQMSSAIINSKFDDALDRSCLLELAESSGAAAESAVDGGLGGDEGLAASLVSMSNHSLRTHRMAYANDSPFANVWDAKLTRSYRASMAWARFFGLGETDEQQQRRRTPLLSVEGRSGDLTGALVLSSQGGTRKRSISAMSGSETSLGLARKISNLRPSQPKRHWSGLALLAAFRRLYGNNKLKWRCPEQERALRLVANKAPEVLLILATGAGKSLAFLLTASLPGARTTVVVVSLVALRLDLTRRSRRLGIDPILFEQDKDIAAGMDSAPALVFVSLELATRPAFKQYARKLYDTGNLDRIVIDECHLILTEEHYRKPMARLSTLRELPVPFVYMTATLSPRLETALRQRHYMGRASVVRGCSKRPNIYYSVEHFLPLSRRTFLAAACKEILERWDLKCKSEWSAPRAMVFLYSRDDVEEVAGHLGCEFYHSKVGSHLDKKAIMERWTSGRSTSPFIVCTSAGGTGVDYPHVRWVVHIGDPSGLTGFLQESGRAGRDGERAESTVLMRRDPRGAAPPTPLDHPDPEDDQALKDYLLGADCRRLCQARVMDAPQHWKSCENDDVPCDICSQPPSQCDQTRFATQVPSQGEQGTELDEETLLANQAGVNQLRRQHMEDQYRLDEYLLRLSIVQDTCLLCRVLTLGQAYDHKMDDCTRQHKWDYIASKRWVLNKLGAKKWLPEYAACYFCGQPQDLCGQWTDGEPEGGPQDCRFRDLAIPAVWATWKANGFEREWLAERLMMQVEDERQALIVAGRPSSFGGRDCVLAVVILAGLLERWETGQVVEAGEGTGEFA
jgi:superfamily II DNA helicase RecQ